ncbi:membrane metallo-endopeptidase-like 1 [Dermacentor variabilis]|uniref:membrane metallo-endopeptidase-like 1 n=1 Tax=Dermacentor variabilis TaxID=34621 RepID=UPI003F5B8733
MLPHACVGPGFCLRCGCLQLRTVCFYCHLSAGILSCAALTEVPKRVGREYSPRNFIPHYYYSGNRIEIPYALFVPPFYQQGLPWSLNYGGIGGTIAHELAYKFLTGELCTRLCSGINWNYDCLLYWQEYHRKREHYQSKQLRIRWSRTLNEDIADNVGLQTAFKAYRRVLEEECEGIDTRLKGLENVTGLQLFFISEARVQCRIADNATLIQQLRWEKFSPAPNRVNVAMKNFEQFARAFNCSPGSPLYPPKNETCSLW